MDLWPLCQALCHGHSDSETFAAVGRWARLLTSAFPDGVWVAYVPSEQNPVDPLSRGGSAHPRLTNEFLDSLEWVGMVSCENGPSPVIVADPLDCAISDDQWRVVLEFAAPLVPAIESFWALGQPTRCLEQWDVEADFFQQIRSTPISECVYANPPFVLLKVVVDALIQWGGTAFVVAPVSRKSLFPGILHTALSLASPTQSELGSLLLWPRPTRIR